MVVTGGELDAVRARSCDYLNEDAVAAGFEITDGETEEHDAEANWTAGEHDGRWAIRESGTCPGETVIQVLAYPAG